MFKTMDTDSHPTKNPLNVWGQFLSHIQPVSLEHLPDTNPSEFHGRLRLAHLGDLRISILYATAHCLHNKPTVVAGKTRSEYVMIMPVSGSIHIRQGGSEISLGRNKSLLINTSYPLDTTYTSPASCLQVMIPEARLRHLQKILPGHSPKTIDCQHGLGMLLRNQTLGLMNGLHEITCEKIAHALGEQLISLLTITLEYSLVDGTGKSQEQRRLTAILTAIDQQLENPDISTSTVANAACISRAYLFKLLKRHHTSFRQEVLNRRLHRAKELLKDPNNAVVPVSEIAWRLGFNSHSHFSRSFQKITGHSPSDYRNLDVKEPTGEEPSAENLELDL